jgi:hypothetical protein
LLLGTRSGAAIKAENMFLRKQLALYLEREVKPRRATDACSSKRSAIFWSEPRTKSPFTAPAE